MFGMLNFWPHMMSFSKMSPPWPRPPKRPSPTTWTLWASGIAPSCKRGACVPAVWITTWRNVHYLYPMPGTMLFAPKKWVAKHIPGPQNEKQFGLMVQKFGENHPTCMFHPVNSGIFTISTACMISSINSSIWKWAGPQKETIVFQPVLFRCYVGFREGIGY